MIVDRLSLLGCSGGINQLSAVRLFAHCEQSTAETQTVISPETMQIFMRVAELASFTQAAQSLGLPKASISTAIQRLESGLGTRLLHRTTRRVQMTQDGQIFYERCREMLSDMDELEGLFRSEQQALTGRLRVDLPMGAARALVLPRLGEFLRAHPHVEIELGSTDRRVDVVREGFDCVLRVGELTDSSLIARPLGFYRQINCASPAYLAEFGVPQTLDDLAHHHLIHYASTLGSKPLGFEYVVRDPSHRDFGATRFLPMSGSLTVNNSESYQAACLAGLGIIQAPDTGALALIERGLLQEVLPDYRPPSMPVSLLYASRRQLPKRVQVFMNWLAELMRPYLESQR
ncbi:MAG: LysR family transcriptional regulator [Verrucomicrobiaceae bacterium]|nr:LysR family transcriptional regulator [Verrucomicrobiaceae bacterium]